MITVQNIPDVCYPIELTVDIGRLIGDVSIIKNRIGFLDDGMKSPSGVGTSINLTHLPGLTGESAWRQHSGQHSRLKADYIDEIDFTERLWAIKDLYINQVMDMIIDIHGRPFVGRSQLVWLYPRQYYPPHRDHHTPHRYHVAIETNDACRWVFLSDTETFDLHMPADGRVWYLDPISMKHTIRNGGTVPRLHILMTSSI